MYETTRCVCARARGEPKYLKYIYTNVSRPECYKRDGTRPRRRVNNSRARVYGRRCAFLGKFIHTESVPFGFHGRTTSRVRFLPRRYIHAHVNRTRGVRSSHPVDEGQVHQRRPFVARNPRPLISRRKIAVSSGSQRTRRPCVTIYDLHVRPIR